MRLIIIGLLVVAIFGLSATAHAQDLMLGEALDAELQAGSVDQWTFVALDGQILSLVVNSSDDSFDPILRIIDTRTDTVLISNDDYDYPTSRDALIEGFSAPRTGTYTVEVSGYGESGGAYTLTLLPGYSQALPVPSFLSQEWVLIDHSDVTTAVLETSADALVLSEEGLGERALAVGPDYDVSTYYLDMSLGSIAGTDGWQMGLVYNYVDASNYRFVAVNNAGAWRVVRVRDGVEFIIRDWGNHPAIVPGQSSYNLGILAKPGGVDVFYDEQFIGSVSDPSLSVAGRIGIDVQTASALGSSVTARVRELQVTVPFQTEGPNIPDRLVAAGNNYTVRELERRNAIPRGGAMVLNLPESFAQNVTAGVSRFPVASNRQFAEFVMGVTVSWRTMGDGDNGCGLVTHDTSDDDTYLLAYVDSLGGVGFATRTDETFTESLYRDDLPLEVGSHDLLLVASAERIYYYVDGHFVSDLARPEQPGGVGLAIVNFEPLDTACRYDDLWIWELATD